MERKTREKRKRRKKSGRIEVCEIFWSPIKKIIMLIIIIKKKEIIFLREV